MGDLVKKEPLPVELGAGPAAGDLKEYGTPGPFTSDIRNFTVSADLRVEGLQPFTQHRASAILGTLDVADNGGILHHGDDYQVNVICRVDNPEYLDVLGRRTVVTRDTKDGSDIGTQNTYLTGDLSFVQQDSGSIANTFQMTAKRTFLKIEDGIVQNALFFDAQCQIGTSSGREPDVGKLVVVGASALQIGRAGQTTDITEFVWLDIPVPAFAGTVNITNYFAINQRDANAKVRLTGEVTMENVAVFLPNLPTTPPAGSGQLWNDGGTLKVTA